MSSSPPAAYSPRTLAEACRHLAAEPRLVRLAGCTDLMVAAAERWPWHPGVIDLTGIAEIRGVREDAGGLTIGATTTFGELRRSPAVRARFPALAEAAAQIGGWQIQNRATLGGNLANASPAGDSLPVLLALEPMVVAIGPRGQREIPYTDFHLGYRRTALAPDEILAWVRLPPPPEGAVQAFRKVGPRAAQAISKVVVAMVGTVTDGRIAELRLAAGSVAPTPVRLARAEAAARGLQAGPEAAARAGSAAASEVTPIDDVRSTAAYRAWALERLVRRLVLGLAPGPLPGEGPI
ncbi:MAG TPA: xanthine dehydrogenase family protein subunit M [Thermoanaerobaculia bacterium]|nr:xanthine dehydrogenase family protein subunit M [Thermoanaerobaculia bacterium]